MTAKLIKVSVVCVTHQQAERLPRLHEALYQTLRTLERDYQFEILYVDDGSTDDTSAALHALADADPRVRVLALSRHFGAEAALIAGLEHANGELILTLDVGCGHPPEFIPELLQSSRGGTLDAVVALAAPRPRSAAVRLLRALVDRVCSHVPPPQATNYVLLSRRAVDVLLTIPEHHRSLLGLIYWLELPRAEVLCPALASTQMRATSLAAGIEHLFAFSRLPLRLATGAGTIFLAVGLLLMFWFPIQALLRPETVWFSWCYLIVLIHLASGSILLALGVVGEYLARTLEQVKQRPLYVLRYDSKARQPKTLPFISAAA